MFTLIILIGCFATGMWVQKKFSPKVKLNDKKALVFEYNSDKTTVESVKIWQL